MFHVDYHDHVEPEHVESGTECDNLNMNKDVQLNLTRIEDNSLTTTLTTTTVTKPVKPQLPAKPNLSVIAKRECTCPSAEDTTSWSSPDIDGPSSMESRYDSIKLTVNLDENSNKQDNFAESNNNYLPANETPTTTPFPTVAEAKRDMKLAELAMELEQARHAKRPAPQPPVPQMDITYTARPTIIEIGPKSEARDIGSSTAITTSPTIPTKPHRFSIKKLLNKKHSSDKVRVFTK